MEQIVYTSTATATVTPAEVFTIIETSARNNPRREVTGFLIFTGCEFLQLVEGPRDGLDDLLADLKGDPRHSALTVLLRQPIERRCFPNWRMQRFDSALADPAGIMMALKIARVSRGVLLAVDEFLVRQKKAA